MGGIRGRAAQDGDGQDAAVQVAAAAVDRLLLTLPNDYVWYTHQGRPASCRAFAARPRRRLRRDASVVRPTRARPLPRPRRLARDAYQFGRPRALARRLVTRLRHLRRR